MKKLPNKFRYIYNGKIFTVEHYYENVYLIYGLGSPQKCSGKDILNSINEGRIQVIYDKWDKLKERMCSE